MHPAHLRARTFAPVFVLALFIGGCCCGDLPSSGGAPASAEPASVFVGSCNDIERMSLCNEYMGDVGGVAEIVGSTTCEISEGTWSTDRCPASDLVLSCERDDQITYWYSSGGTPYEHAKATNLCNCAQGNDDCIRPGHAGGTDAQHLVTACCLKIYDMAIRDGKGKLEATSTATGSCNAANGWQINCAGYLE